MARFCSLYSSSSGNCTYIGTPHGGILVDIGVSAKRAEAALRDIGVEPSSIEAIFVTHEHTDHISGVRVFASRYGIKVYASAGTLEGMEAAGALKAGMNYDIASPEGTEAAGMYVRPFRTPHDSRESTGYTVVTPDSKRIAVATDIGKMTPTIMDAVSGSDLILLESNHDVGMLQNGPYPYILKQRILSDVGHLSNVCCSDTAVKLIESGTTRFVLGHLSKENNLPELAYEAVRMEITMGENPYRAEDFRMMVADRSNVSPVINIA